MQPTPPELDYHHPHRLPGRPVLLTLVPITFLLWACQIIIILDPGPLPWPLYDTATVSLLLTSVTVGFLDLFAYRFVALSRSQETSLCLLGLITFAIAILAPAFYRL
jgi:hypothetical protein